MTSAIDVTKPTAGTATTQSVRDNFSAAYDEINAQLRMTTDLATSTTGSAQTQTASFTNVPTLATGLRLTVQFTYANTGADPTIRVDGSTDSTIKRSDGNDLVAGEIAAGQVYDLIYDGTNFRLITSTSELFSEYTTATYSGLDPEADFFKLYDASGSQVIKSLIEEVGKIIMPPGLVMASPVDPIPTGYRYLECNGQALNASTSTEYQRLYDVIGNTYGGTNNTDFQVPDYRGYFLRGFNDSSGNDPDAASRTDRGDGTTGDAVGTKQGFALENITGDIITAKNGTSNSGLFTTSASNLGGAPDGNQATGRRVNFDASNVVTTSTETRPLNANVIWVITY